MPTRPNLGYAAALGGAGGFDSLHKLIAERQKQQEEAQLMRLRDEAAALAERKLEEDTKYRQSIQEQNVIERDQMQQYRDRVLAKQEEALANTRENQQIDNARAAFDNTPGGRIYDEAGYQQGVKAGYGPAFERVPGGHALAPPQYKFAGGATWLKGEKDRESTAYQRTQDRLSGERQSAERLATTRAIAELARGGQADKGWTFREDDSKEGGSYYKMVDGKIEVTPLPPGSLVGPAAARASKKAETFVPFISALNTLKEVGKRYKWEGVGPLSTWEAGMQAVGLHQPTEAATKVRAALGDARSLIANQRYGAALTDKEKDILNTFVATIDTQGKVTEQMIDEVLEVELNAMRDVAKGARDIYEQMRPTPAAKTDIESITPYLPSLSPDDGVSSLPPRPVSSGSRLKIVGVR